MNRRFQVSGALRYQRQPDGHAWHGDCADLLIVLLNFLGPLIVTTVGVLQFTPANAINR